VVTDEQPLDSDETTPPREPFAHLSNNPYFGIRSPLLQTVLFVGFALGGLWLAGMGVFRRFPLGEGPHLGPIIIGVLWFALGAFAVYMGIRRMRWKREYERVMGRSPW
jgi:hypothetical protein